MQSEGYELITAVLKMWLQNMVFYVIKN